MVRLLIVGEIQAVVNGSLPLNTNALNSLISDFKRPEAALTPPFNDLLRASTLRHCPNHKKRNEVLLRFLAGLGHGRSSHRPGSSFQGVLKKGGSGPTVRQAVGNFVGVKKFFLL
jgi:hypothetical protein